MKDDKEKLTPWAIFAIVFSFIVVAYLALPLFAGIGAILFKEISPDNSLSLSIDSLNGIIILAAALGGFVLWFVENSKKKVGPASSNIRMVKMVGMFFLYSALLFSLFMLLSPLIPIFKEETGWYYGSLKYITGIAFIGGSVTFIYATIYGLIYAWRL